MAGSTPASTTRKHDTLGVRQEGREGLTRRQLLKRAAAVGGVWAAPVVQSIAAPAFAQASPPCCIPEDQEVNESNLSPLCCCKSLGGPFPGQPCTPANRGQIVFLSGPGLCQPGAACNVFTCTYNRAFVCRCPPTGCRWFREHVLDTCSVCPL